MFKTIDMADFYKEMNVKLANALISSRNTYKEVAIADLKAGDIIVGDEDESRWDVPRYILSVKRQGKAQYDGLMEIAERYKLDEPDTKELNKYYISNNFEVNVSLNNQARVLEIDVEDKFIVATPLAEVLRQL